MPFRKSALKGFQVCCLDTAGSRLTAASKGLTSSRHDGSILDAPPLQRPGRHRCDGPDCVETARLTVAISPSGGRLACYAKENTTLHYAALSRRFSARLAAGTSIQPKSHKHASACDFESSDSGSRPALPTSGSPPAASFAASSAPCCTPNSSQSSSLRCRRMATLPELVRHPSLAEADVPMADMGHPGGFARADSCLSGVDAPDAGPGAPWHSGGLLSPQGMARKFQFRDKPWFTSQTVSAGQAAGMPDPALDPSPSTLMRAGSFDPMKAWLSVTTRTDNSRADGLQSINFLPEG
ncbi:hypothetical protein WJX73_009017 [Symbiochloris irregularis]|uniref:Uncharacterized protein n=1 Tax=Symbiochloris irregularis TaxID=706552 RepID=A0AAW1PJJ1_9CHLO